MDNARLPLSLVIITLNEEKNIKRCIESVPFASDIVVLDSFSKDKTKEIALQLGARFFEQSWLGFGRQKKKAVELAKFDWVLCLDADERLSLESQKEILSRFSNLNVDVGYSLPRLSFHLGRWIRYGGWYPDYQLRLFNRSYSNWVDSEIHEKVDAKFKEKLNSPIEHFVFDSLSDQVVTNDRYSSLQASQMIAEGRTFSIFNFLTKPWVKFIECYLFKLGFLDGWAGFIIAVSAAYSVFLKHAKVWESLKK